MKVCILGYGLTSLALAKALVNRDIYVDIIYKQKHKIIDQSRTLGISNSNIDFFNKHISNINKILWEIKKIQILTANHKVEDIIKFQNIKSNLFCIIQNYKIFKQLNFELKKSKFINFKKEMSYQNLIKLDYNLIINCDFNNQITKKFFARSLNKKYNSTAYITVINHKKLPTNNTAIQIFTDKGPLAFLPISETKTSIVYSEKNAKSRKKININNLIHKFNPRYEILKINKFSKFDLESANLRKYFNKNILAFGDLLHKIHPLAGQGFNMSIRDIRDLIEIIDNKILLGLPLDKTVCKEFEIKTKSKNFLFSTGVDLIYEFFNFESKIQSNLVNSTVKIIGKNKLLNEYFKKFADNGLEI